MPTIWTTLATSAAAWTRKNWSVGISDSETFGTRKQITASTGLSYSQSEYTGQQTETINANENHHGQSPARSWTASLMMNFNQSELTSDSYARLQGTAGVRHQLYESLTSNFDVHGTYRGRTPPLPAHSTI